MIRYILLYIRNRFEILVGRCVHCQDASLLRLGFYIIECKGIIWYILYDVQLQERFPELMIPILFRMDGITITDNYPRHPEGCEIPQVEWEVSFPSYRVQRTIHIR